MRAATSFAILALLAGATSTFGAPLTQRNDPSTVNVGHSDAGKNNRLADAQVNRVGDVNVYNNNGNYGNGNKQGSSVNYGNPNPIVVDAHSADNVHPLTGSKKNDAADISKDTSNKSLKDDKVTVFPASKAVPGKDGFVSVQNGDVTAHVLQAPGMDKTLADAQAGTGDGKANHKADTKVNLPTNGDGDNDLFGFGGSRLAGKPNTKPANILDAAPIIQIGDNVNDDNNKNNKNNNGGGNPKPSQSASQTPKASASASAPARVANAQQSSPASASAPASHSAQPTASHPAASPSAPASQAAAAQSAGPQSQAAKPAQQSQQASAASSPASQSPKPSQGSKPPQSSAAAPKASNAPASSSTNGQGSKPPSDGDDDDELRLHPGALLPSRPKDQPKVGDLTGDNNGKGPNRADNGYPITATSSTGGSNDKKMNLTNAQLKASDMQEHVQPCDTRKQHAANDLVDICIEADLLAYAPKNTFKCPDEMQHDMYVHGEEGQNTSSQLSKEVAKYVKLCVDAGAL